MALDRQDVVEAAVRILDEFGMADLSMRRLADALGVKAGALYWHVANKQTLLAAVADRVLSELPPVDASLAPGRALEAWARDLRRVLLAHRDSAELVGTALATGLCEHDPRRAVVGLLVHSGMTGERAGWSADALLHLVLGHVAEEQNLWLVNALGVREVPGGGRDDPGFRHGVGCLVAGLTSE